MKQTYGEHGDSASVLTGREIVPGGNHYKERLDADRFVRIGADDVILEYEFLNVRRYGVRLDDLTHRDELARLFGEAGIPQRDWSHPVPTQRRKSRLVG